MSKFDPSRFNNILKEIIEKSLFTERQIEIILKQKNLGESKFSITRGAYYRQVGQSRDKLIGLYYSIILLQGLGVLSPSNVDVTSRLAEQVSVIKDSDIFPEREQEIIDVMDNLVRQACDM